MSYYQNNPNAPAQKPKKEVINKVELTGIIKARGVNETDPIKYYPFSNGNGVSHFEIKCTEPAGLDENNNPKMKTVSVPVSVFTNKEITPTKLSSLQPGMKVRIVGSLVIESYDSKKNPGSKVSRLVVRGFILDILSAPVQMAYGTDPYPGQQGVAYGQQFAPQPPQAYPPQYQAPPAYSPYPAPPQQMPPAPAAPPQYHTQAQNYGPHQAPQAPQAPQFQPQAQNYPPQYQPQASPAGGPAPTQMPGVDDMPDFNV